MRGKAVTSQGVSHVAALAGASPGIVESPHCAETLEGHESRHCRPILPRLKRSDKL